MRQDPPSNRLPDNVRAAIETHFSRVKPGLAAVSISNTVHAIRSAAPDCALSDDILADAVARHAIDNGYGVHFDGKDRLAVMEG